MVVAPKTRNSSQAMVSHSGLRLPSLASIMPICRCQRLFEIKISKIMKLISVDRSLYSTFPNLGWVQSLVVSAQKLLDDCFALLFRKIGRTNNLHWIFQSRLVRFGRSYGDIILIINSLKSWRPCATRGLFLYLSKLWCAVTCWTTQVRKTASISPPKINLNKHGSK